MKKIFLIILVLGLILKFGFGQIEDNYLVGNKVYSASSTVDKKFFQEEFLEILVLKRVNEIRTERGFDPYEKEKILADAAELQVSYMCEIEELSTTNENKKLSTTYLRLQHFGGSGIGTELIQKESIRKSGIYLTYKDLADEITFGWFNSKKDSKKLLSNEYTLSGISIKLDHKRRKVYVSFILGNFLSLNAGKNGVNNLEHDITQPSFFKWKRLENYDYRTCRKIERLENPSILQQGLQVDDENNIYLITDEPRMLKKFMRNKHDGIAIDIIWKDQFLCDGPNKVDYSLVNRGNRTNPVWAKNFWKKNEIEGKYPRSVKVSLGKLPEEFINEDYELNLLLIQDNHVCKSIPKSYISECEGNYTQDLKLLADTVTINTKFNYHPKADSTELSFRIPFEKKKYIYRTEDIEPFIKLLNEPDFVIYELKISAFSSIEGIAEENELLQSKRAESIVNALRERQKDNMISEIITKPAWEQFKKDIKSTQHNILASMKIDEAREYISKYKLSKKLEPILSKHRYAQIDMKVTYDISGEKEQLFVVKKFNKAIEKKDLPMALSIQKYIMKQVLSGRYSLSAVYEQKIPQERQFAGMLMNKLWLEMRGTNTTPQDHQQKIAELLKLDRYNEYIAFNHALCRVLYEQFTDERQIESLQSDIDRFYYKSFTKETVDNLNMRFQFRVINSADSLDKKDKIIDDRIEKIKEIVDIREESIENSLRLAELFIQNKDYAFATELLDAFVEQPNAPEEMIFTYLSLCSRFEDRMLGRKFARVMEQAYRINPDRYCQLFDGKHFSFRVFENKLVKEKFCKNCSRPTITKRPE